MFQHERDSQQENRKKQEKPTNEHQHLVTGNAIRPLMDIRSKFTASKCYTQHNMAAEGSDSKNDFPETALQAIKSYRLE